MSTVRRTLLVAFTVVVLPLAALLSTPACHELTPADEARVSIDAIQMSTCVASAHLCKVALVADASVEPCYKEFDDCMYGHGFMDGGK